MLLKGLIGMLGEHNMDENNSLGTKFLRPESSLEASSTFSPFVCGKSLNS
jgi:hypothetical protein